MAHKIAGALMVGLTLVIFAYGNEIAALLGMQITDAEMAAAGESIRGSLSGWDIFIVVVGILAGSRVLAWIFAGALR